MPIPTAAECAEIRARTISRIRESIDEYKQERGPAEEFFDWLTNSTPTEQGILDGMCCKGEKNGCDCDQVASYIRDQDAVIAGLEQYIQAGNFRTFPMVTPLATSGPLGIRPKDASCCIKRLIELMEEWFASSDGSPSPTFKMGLYLGLKMVVSVAFDLGGAIVGMKPWQRGLMKKAVGVDITDFNKARASIELNRSKAFRELLCTTYAICCCNGDTPHGGSTLPGDVAPVTGHP